MYANTRGKLHFLKMEIHNYLTCMCYAGCMYPTIQLTVRCGMIRNHLGLHYFRKGVTLTT